MNGWLIFAALVLGYLGILSVLKRRTQPLPGGFEINGPFIFWRTQFGKPWLQRIARARGFWNAVADVGIIATWITGLAIFALLIYSLTLYFTAPDLVVESATPPQFLIGLPGVNPLIPVWYGLAALIVALVIHEGSHGVMAYVGRMRVKSLGLLLFVVPVGAFVEPDEEDIEKATAREKNRVFAAGPTSNLIVAILCGLVLTSMLGSVAVANDGQGIGVGSIVDDSPAAAAGLQPGDVLVSLNGTRIVNGTHFTEVLNDTRAGQRVPLEYMRDGQVYAASAVLMDKYEYLETAAPSANEESFRGKGFLGMGNLNLGFVDLLRDRLADPFSDGFPGSFSTGGRNDAPGSFIFFISYPFLVFATGVDVFAAPYREFLVVDGWAASIPEPLFFGTIALLYWIVWINIMLGTFNALPAGPLDGGQMLKATLRERLMRRYKVDREALVVERAEMGGMRTVGRDEVTQQKLDRIQGIVSRTTWTLGMFILMLIVLPMFGPQLLGLFI